MTPPDIIGTAFMYDDGTILLDIRCELPGGGEGLSRLEYPKFHRYYEEVLRHVGGLLPGESKPVRPWPEEKR